jgi:hypothetical protein
MTKYFEVKAETLILFLLAYGGLCALGGALILGPTLCEPIAPTTTAIEG